MSQFISCAMRVIAIDQMCNHFPRVECSAPFRHTISRRDDEAQCRGSLFLLPTNKMMNHRLSHTKARTSPPDVSLMSTPQPRETVKRRGEIHQVHLRQELLNHGNQPLEIARPRYRYDFAVDERHRRAFGSLAYPRRPLSVSVCIVVRRTCLCHQREADWIACRAT